MSNLLFPVTQNVSEPQNQNQFTVDKLIFKYQEEKDDNSRIRSFFGVLFHLILSA